MNDEVVKMQTQCLVCGSSDVEVREVTRYVTIPFAAPVAYSTRVFTCHACDDVFEESVEPFKGAERTAITASATNIINTLADRGITMAYVERALRLPQRTLTGERSAVAVALLRIVETFPGILAALDTAYDHMVVHECKKHTNPQEVLNNFGHSWSNHMSATDEEFRKALAAKAQAGMERQRRQEAARQLQEKEYPRLVQELYSRIQAKVDGIPGVTVTVGEPVGGSPYGTPNLIIEMPDRKVMFRPTQYSNKGLNVISILVNNKEIDPSISIDRKDPMEPWNLYLMDEATSQPSYPDQYYILTNELLIQLLKKVLDIY